MRGIILKTFFQYGHILVGIVLRLIHIGKVLQQVFVALLVFLSQGKIAQSQFGLVQLVATIYRKERSAWQLAVGIEYVVTCKDGHFGTIYVKREEGISLVVHLLAHEISATIE